MFGSSCTLLVLVLLPMQDEDVTQGGLGRYVSTVDLTSEECNSIERFVAYLNGDLATLMTDIVKKVGAGGPCACPAQVHMGTGRHVHNHPQGVCLHNSRNEVSQLRGLWC